MLLPVICFGPSGCAGKHAEASETDQQTVTVSYPLKRAVTDYQVYTGRTAAVDSVQIRARVTGYLQKVDFQDGAEVKEGEALVEIDPRPYQAAVDADTASVAMNEASLKLAQQNNSRSQTLFSEKAPGIMQAEVDQSQSQLAKSVASLNQSKASLETTRLNLDWTKVTAPVSGQISYKLVTRGNLITADQTILTTIVSQDPMWVYFNVDEPTIVRLRQLIRQGKIPSTASGKVAHVPVSVALTGEEGFPHEGYVDFANNQLDQATATLLVRAVLPNPKPPVGERVFTPAMFVRVRLPIGSPYEALLVSEAAVGTDQNLKYLYVVNERNTVVRHAVNLGTQQEGLQVISTGLQPGEHVIVNGLQHVHPGDVVNPTLVVMPAGDKVTK